MKRAASTIALTCLLMAGVLYSQVELDGRVTHDFEKSKARATLLALLCYTYETDNGTFPLSIADLHWPIDYVSNFERTHGVKFRDLENDPLSSGNSRFFVRPVIRHCDSDQRRGVDFRQRNAAFRFAVISPSGAGGELVNFHVLYEDSLSSGSMYLDPSASIQFISDDMIRDLASSDIFDIKKVLSAAGAKQHDP